MVVNTAADGWFRFVRRPNRVRSRHDLSCQQPDLSSGAFVDEVCSNSTGNRLIDVASSWSNPGELLHIFDAIRKGALLREHIPVRGQRTLCRKRPLKD